MLRIYQNLALVGDYLAYYSDYTSFFLTDDSAAESFNGNETLGHSSVASGGAHVREPGDSSSDGKTGLEQEEQPLNLSDSPLSAQLTSEYRIDEQGSNGKSKFKNLLISDLKMEGEARENGSKVRLDYNHWMVCARSCISRRSTHTHY